MGNNFKIVLLIMDNQIFWLASYPKSGNTLLRSILISLFFTKDGIFTIDKSNSIGQFDTTFDRSAVSSPLPAF